MGRAGPDFACSACGYAAARWLGRCPECDAWGTLEPRPASGERGAGAGDRAAVTRPLTRIDGADERRWTTSIAELDTVLGGGVVPGAVVLLGGEPGIGKSTLLLQAACAIARAGRRVLYVSGEESAGQLAARARRLDALHDGVSVAVDTDVDALVQGARSTSPELVIVDSIQAVRCAGLPSTPGSVTQVREAAARFVAFAKSTGTPVLLIGHVTKDGSLAGPRVLEHIVDTVVQFEGDRHHEHRVLRALKNRFGPSDELGVFRMTDRGLLEVANPSEFLLAGRTAATPGSVVLASVEGSRPLLVEIQALVGEACGGSPRRAALGFDGGRLAMILAVLQRSAGLELGGRDVFVNVTGGLSIGEPAADLAVAVAVASSVTERPAVADAVVAGEIGLAGELRAVGRLEARVREASRLGFGRAIVPRRGTDGLRLDALEIHRVDDVRRALSAALTARAQIG